MSPGRAGQLSVNRARRGPGISSLLCAVAGLFLFLSSPPERALADSLAIGDSLAFADSLGLERALGLPDSLASADSLAARDSLAPAGPAPASPTPHAAPPGTDLRALRLELGGSTDITNELFYEDQFDSTFRVLGRKSIMTPETRYAAVLYAGFEGTRADRATHYDLGGDLSLGDKVQRGTLVADWRGNLSQSWMLRVAPRLEARHDRTFGRDLSEWRGQAASRLQRRLWVSGTAAELGLAGDLVRAAGSGSEFVLDRNAATATVALEHAGDSDDWRLGGALTARSFPDSASRDHRELGLEGRWRHAFEAGDWLTFEAGGLRRRTVEPAPTSRDDLLEGRLALEGEVHTGLSWSLTGDLEGQALNYEFPDSTLYFDQTVLRAGFAPRVSAGPFLSLAAGPRLEALRSPLAPAEEYLDLGGVLEFESFGRGAWWRLVPAAGRRAYRIEAQRGRFDPLGLHTDYTFLQLDVIADQGLGAGWRVRLLVTGRLERHTDPGDDSRSLYFSLDLRRLLSPGSSVAPVAASARRFGQPGI